MVKVTIDMQCPSYSQLNQFLLLFLLLHSSLIVTGPTIFNSSTEKLKINENQRNEPVQCVYVMK